MDARGSPNVFELVVFGCEGVGKSALTFQFVQQHFLEEYDPTIEDRYRKRAAIDDEPCLLDILDTAVEFHRDDGCGGADLYRNDFVRTSRGFVMVYAISSRASFDGLPALREHFLRVKQTPNGVAMVLVGNKCDLEDQREVSVNEGAEMARSFGCRFVETSAKSGINVEECFFGLVRDIRRQAAEGRAALREETKSNKRCLLS